MSKPLTPFPTLLDEPPERWQWPVPPFAWYHLPAPMNDVAQPCRLEIRAARRCTARCSTSIRPRARSAFGPRRPARAVTIAFARFCRLTLTAPLQPAPQIAGAPVERVPAAAQEREYRLHTDAAVAPLTGRTAGHVETADGLYLYAPFDEEASLQRVFVPRSAYTRCEFGASAEEIAASRWIATREALLEALERQQRMPVLPLGHSLLGLGLLTQEQLDRALARQPDNQPLGETLVATGLITRANLQTALAHKMGYPLVDLTRFPLDPAAAAKLPQRIAVSHRALPLMLDGTRLIVAVDNPSRVVKLQSIHAIAELTVVPVLAPKGQILMALARLSQDVWSQHVPQRVGFFATTV